MRFAEALFEKVDLLLNQSATTTSQAIAGYLGAIAAVGITIYLVLTAYAIARGDIETPMSKLTKDFLKIAFVLMIALPGGMYQNIVVDGLSGLQDMLVSAASGSSNVGRAIDRANSGCTPLPAGNSAAEWEACIPYTNKLMAAAEENSNAIGIPDLSYVFATLVIGLSQVVISACCILPVLLAKIGFVVGIALGPICILMLLWPPTQNYFTGWLSLTLAFAITQVIVAIIVSVIPQGFGYFIQNAMNYQATGESHVLSDSLTVLIVAIGLGFTAIQASGMATQLVGGGVSLNTGGLAGAFVQRFIMRGAMGKGGTPPSTGGKGGEMNQNQGVVGRSATATGRAAGRVSRVIGNAIGRK